MGERPADAVLAGGAVAEKAFLRDYAMLILGLIDLYEACFEVKWLRDASTRRSR